MTYEKLIHRWRSVKFWQTYLMTHSVVHSMYYNVLKYIDLILFTPQNANFYYFFQESANLDKFFPKKWKLGQFSTSENEKIGGEFFTIFSPSREKINSCGRIFTYILTYLISYPNVLICWVILVLISQTRFLVYVNI